MLCYIRSDRERKDAMKTWNEIMSQPGSPEERLEDFFELWMDIMSIYDAVPIMTFSPSTYCAIPNGKYQRGYFPVNTASVIKVPQSDTVTLQISSIASMINEDDANYDRIKSWAATFNTVLNKEERAVIVRRYFYHENYSKISRKCSFSVRSYYRIVGSAKKKLIEAFSLDLYDEYGCAVLQ